MSTLYIREYSALTVYGGVQPLQMAEEPGVDQAPIPISGVNAVSAAFGLNTRYVRLESDVVCSFVFGSTPVATTGNARMAAGAYEYFGVIPGQKVAVIGNS